MVFQQVQRPESTFSHVTFDVLTKEDAAVSHLQNSAYTRPASDDRIANAKAAMEAKGFVVHVVKDKDEAFNKTLELIPEVKQMKKYNGSILVFCTGIFSHANNHDAFFFFSSCLNGYNPIGRLS